MWYSCTLAPPCTRAMSPTHCLSWQCHLPILTSQWMFTVISLYHCRAPYFMNLHLDSRVIKLYFYHILWQHSFSICETSTCLIILFELSCYLNNCASLTLRQELDLLMQHGWPKCQPQWGCLDVCNGNLYFIDLFGNHVDEKETYIAQSLVGKNTLSIKHF